MKCIFGLCFFLLFTACTKDKNGPLSELDHGKLLYDTHCQTCHGVNGKGDGEMAKMLYPKPRNLASGIFKYRTTHGSIPDDIDLLQTMKMGVPGTSMPGWDVLPEKDWKALLAYIKMLVPRLQEGRPGSRIEVPPMPTTSKVSVEAGRVLYATIGCVACHGAEGKGNGMAAMSLRDAWGDIVPPRDLVRGPLKWGNTDQDLYRTLTLGIPGTPMPGYSRTLTQTEIWQLASYVRSLQKMPPDTNPSSPKRYLIKSAVIHDIPGGYDASAWQQTKPVPVFLHQLTSNSQSAEWLEVKTLANTKSIAFALRWEDTKADGDGVALQFPAKTVDEPSELPFVGMGNIGKPVLLIKWDGEQIRAWKAEGMDRLTPYEVRGVVAKGVYDKGFWKVVIQMPRSLIESSDPNYISFATWDRSVSAEKSPQSFSEWMMTSFE
ncbi:MAG: c-type cytochrome [Deltaproteobacteria bacterium]|nr:c-type cytochrome [Deltaproteobacteria bacterium]